MTRTRQSAPVIEAVASEPARPGGSNRVVILLLGCLGLALVAFIGLALSWGSIQRSRQLAALDACRDGEHAEEARQLAVAFAQEWGPRSEHVVAAINDGRGTLEARVELCRAGGHLRLLAQLLSDDTLTPAQRGLACAALSELWPEDGRGPGVSPSLPAWALAPESDPALSGPALRLLMTMAAPDTDGHLARAAADGRLSAERAVAAAVGFGRVADKRGSGATPLIVALGGAHRAALLASPAVVDSVRRNAVPADAAKLLELLERPDTVAIGLAGLGGKRFLVADSDLMARSRLTSQLIPYLALDADDEKLAGALLVVHRSRLIGARAQVLALLPRLGRRRPPQLPKDDLAELLGKSLVSSKTPENHAAAEEVVTALAAALDNDAARSLAIVALSRVQDVHVAALRPALDGLAACGEDGAAAIGILVGTVYARDDLVQASRRGGWGPVLAEDRRKRARLDAIARELSQPASEAKKDDVVRIRDEIKAWQASSDPLPLGITKAMLDDYAKRVQARLD